MNYLLLVKIATVIALVICCGMMFEHVLNFWIHKDVPFWLDAIAGTCIAPVTFVSWVVTLVCNYSGYVSPDVPV